MFEKPDADPVFEAIRHHRVTHQNYLVFRTMAENCPADPDRFTVADKLREDAEAAAWALVETPPTTPFGLRALALYANEIVESGHSWPKGWGRRLHSVVIRAYGLEPP